MVGMKPGYDDLDPSFRNREIVAIGSSTTQGTVGITNQGWTEELRLLMQPRWGKGGIGMVQPFREGWSFTTGADAWTDEGSATVADAGSSAGAVKTAAILTAIASYIVGAGSGIAADGFYLYFMDKAGSGTPSYSIDGGAWVNVPGVTFTGSNNVKRSSLISTAYTTSVRVRAGNAAGTAQQVSVHGIEPVILTGSDRNGAVVHNFGRNADFLASAARGSGTPILKTLQVIDPDVLIVMYTNDILFWPGSSPRGDFWTTNLNTLYTVAALLGANLMLMIYWQRGDVDTEQEVLDEADLRNRTRAFAATNTLPLIDFRETHFEYQNAEAAGFIVGSGDIVHPSTTGTQYIANQVWKYLSRTGAETFVRV